MIALPPGKNYRAQLNLPGTGDSESIIMIDSIHDKPGFQTLRETLVPLASATDEHGNIIFILIKWHNELDLLA
jgi:hypothetical protein